MKMTCRTFLAALFAGSVIAGCGGAEVAEREVESGAAATEINSALSMFSCDEAEGCRQQCVGQVKALVSSGWGCTVIDAAEGPGCEVVCVPQGACVKPDFTYCKEPALEPGGYLTGLTAPGYGDPCRCDPLSSSPEGQVW